MLTIGTLFHDIERHHPSSTIKCNLPDRIDPLHLIQEFSRPNIPSLDRTRGSCDEFLVIVLDSRDGLISSWRVVSKGVEEVCSGWVPDFDGPVS